MYIEKKKIGNETYNYLKMSVRYKNKVRTKTIAYLGKDDKNLDKIKEKYKQKEKEIKKQTLKELKEETSKTELFLTNKQLEKLEYIKEDFNKKLTSLDERTKKDMFDDFLIVYVYNTNAIEGNTFSLRDTDLLLNKGITPGGKTLREINDHLNAKEVFEYILSNKLTLNHDNIIKIHTRLMKNIDTRFGYRLHDVRGFGAKFESSPAKYVKADMNILLKWYKENKNKLNPLVLASIFHHKFERIHPFYDGNGRTGRMLLNLILLQNKLPTLTVADAQRKRYYLALEKVDKTGLNQVSKDYEEIVDFCYFCLLKTYNTIFDRWK